MSKIKGVYYAGFCSGSHKYYICEFIFKLDTTLNRIKHIQIDILGTHVVDFYKPSCIFWTKQFIGISYWKLFLNVKG